MGVFVALAAPVSICAESLEFPSDSGTIRAARELVNRVARSWSIEENNMVEREQWITQTQAAELRGLSLKAVNALVLRGRVRSKEVYGKRLVHRNDIMNYEPMTRNRWSKAATTKSASKKGKAKKTTGKK